MCIRDRVTASPWDLARTASGKTVLITLPCQILCFGAVRVAQNFKYTNERPVLQAACLFVLGRRANTVRQTE